MLLAQLASSIEATYRANKIYTNPTITIVMQPQSRFVNVGGALCSPSRIAFTEDMTLLTAINAAGGFNDFAERQKASPLTAGEKRDNVRMCPREFRRNPSKEVTLEPGDRVEVPQSFF